MSLQPPAGRGIISLVEYLRLGAFLLPSQPYTSRQPSRRLLQGNKRPAKLDTLRSSGGSFAFSKGDCDMARNRIPPGDGEMVINAFGRPMKKAEQIHNARRNSLSKSEVRRRVWDKTAGRCWYCGHQTNPWREFCIDHLIPMDRGGTEDLDNLVPCCRRCNAQKRHMIPDEYRKVIEQKDRACLSKKQAAYLVSRGLFHAKPYKHRFYFELEGL